MGLRPIRVFVEEHDLGETTGADGGYRPDPEHPEETELGPDVAFVRTGRAPTPTSPEYARAWPLTLDLAVEVASPNQYRPALAEKATLYLSFGTRLVWVVWPRLQQVDVWRPGDKQPSATLGVGDILDGEDVVPGFTYAIASLFA